MHHLTNRSCTLFIQLLSFLIFPLFLLAPLLAHASCPGSTWIKNSSPYKIKLQLVTQKCYIVHPPPRISEKILQPNDQICINYRVDPSCTGEFHANLKYEIFAKVQIPGSRNNWFKAGWWENPCTPICSLRASRSMKAPLPNLKFYTHIIQDQRAGSTIIVFKTNQ